MKKSLFSLLLLVATVTVVQANIVDLSERIVSQSQKLQRSVYDMRYGSSWDHRIAREDATELRRMVERMLMQLDGEGPRPPMPPTPPTPPTPPYPPMPPRPTHTISASCEYDIGGNFFNPETKVECTVYGRGAAGYEVEVVSKYNRTIEFRGTLEPQQTTQQFKTDEEKVGGSGVTYNVYILTREGAKILVNTRRASTF